MRLAIFRLDDSVYKFVWTFHHILLDGRAFPIVLEEVFLFYEAFRKGRDIDTEMPRPYRDYIEWLQHRDLRQEEEFWRNALSGFRALTPFPRRIFGGRKRLGAEGAEELRLSVQLTSRLREFAERNNFALNTLVEGAWACCYTSTAAMRT